MCVYSMGFLQNMRLQNGDFCGFQVYLILQASGFVGVYGLVYGRRWSLTNRRSVCSFAHYPIKNLTIYQIENEIRSLIEISSV